MSALSWVRAYRPPQHRRPANTAAARLAAQVRGVLVDRLDRRLADALPALCREFGLTEAQGLTLVSVVLAAVDPGQFDDDAPTAARLGLLAGGELVPDTGLERCGAAQLEAFLAEPEPAATPAAASESLRSEMAELLAARTAKLKAGCPRASPVAAVARLAAAVQRPA